MPRPRFDNLPDSKRLRILEAAAQEFAAKGYDNASVNQILEQAEISKGAAYYYFDDKADMFLTALEHYSRATLDNVLIDLDTLQAGRFWDELAAIYQQQFMLMFDHPWLMALFQAARSLSAEARLHDRLNAMLEELLAWPRTLLERGQELGTVRTDLPGDLLVSLMLAVDTAHDQWMYEHLAELEQDPDRAGIAQAMAARVIDLLRRVLAP